MRLDSLQSAIAPMVFLSPDTGGSTGVGDPLMDLLADSAPMGEAPPEPTPEETTETKDEPDEPTDDSGDTAGDPPAGDPEPEPETKEPETKPDETKPDEAKPDAKVAPAAEPELKLDDPRPILADMQAAQIEAQQAVNEYNAAKAERASIRKQIKEADDALDAAELTKKLVDADEKMEAAQEKYNAAQQKYQGAEAKHQAYQQQAASKWFADFGKARGVSAADASAEYNRLCESYAKKYPGADVRVLAAEKLEEWATAQKAKALPPAPQAKPAPTKPAPQVRKTGVASTGGKGDAKPGEMQLDPFAADVFLL